MVRRVLLPDHPTTVDLRTCERDFALAADLLDRLRGEVQKRDASKLRSGATYAELPPLRVGLLLRAFEAEGKAADLVTAFGAAEQGRGRVLAESLGQRDAARLAGAPPALRQQEEQLLARIRVADARIARLDAIPTKDRPKGTDPQALWKERDAAEAELVKVVAELQKVAPRYADLRHPNPCTVAQARAALEPGEAALHFVLGTEASYLIVLDREPAQGDPGNGLAVHKLPPRQQIEGKLTGLLDEDVLRSEVRARGAGAELYQMLLAPAAERLKGKKGLVVVPDGDLCYLPFQLLVDKDDRFLVETHRIRYAPSLTTLHLTKQWADARAGGKTLPDRPLFAVGDPDYGGRGGLLATLARASRGTPVRSENFERLTHSGREVTAIADLLGKENCRVLVRGAATESAVKEASAVGELARYRYLHFACHGVLGVGPGQPPGLVLSLPGASGADDGAGGADDGYLRADEVLGLRLNADLAVLSACRSGKGRLHAGEGVEGLARSFLYAGSRGVVCTLWSVDDAATAGLMAGMYRRLQKGEPAADALRAAQLEMLKAGKPPLHWAPATLNGQ